MLGIYLAGHNPDLGFWEVLQLARRRGERVRRVTERYVLVLSDDLRFYMRLAYARLVGKHRFFFRRVEEFGTRALEDGLKREIAERGPFRVRAFPRGEIERRIGWWLDGEVDLEKGKTVAVVRVGDVYAALYPTVEISERSFRERDPKNRPFFHPTALKARDARMLVNLSGVLPGEVFLDPFCGTGSLLIEAALVGARPVGVDADPRMVEGAKKNLAHFGLSGDVVLGDARSVRGEYDAIATDPPYGRSSKVFGEIGDAFASLHDVLRMGRFCVVVYDRDITSVLERAGFFVMHVGKWYVHKNLTRRVHICRA